MKFDENFIKFHIDINYLNEERKARRKKTNEFFTPYSIIKRMGDKIPEEDWSDPDKTFLEPCAGNGNFVLYIIYNRLCHGIDIEQILKTLYTVELMPDNVAEMKKRILDMLDELNIDIGNGKFDINDFLEMDNNEILRENKGKKFDIILSNPPWGQNIHYEFTQKYLDIADTVISIMPNSIVKRDTKHFKKYKEAYNDYLYDVEELDSKNFEDTNMQNCCIFCFSQDKKDLHIKYIDGKEEHISGILEKDYSGFTDYEKDIVKYLYNEKPNIVEGGHGLNGKSIKKDLVGFANKLISKLPDNKAYLIVSAADGSMKAKYFSSKIGQIFDNKEDLKEWILQSGGVKLHYMYFDSVKAAENAKSAMLRPVLRFPLVRTKTDRQLCLYHYRYISDINWEDERVKTDEGLLEVCGCPKDKCKEYADYCRKVIEEKR